MIGQQIGNYRLVKLLGAGGMGMVYEAVHDGIGGRAAIKVLRPEIASHKDATQRFFSEARAANLVAHPAIVHIFDCGYTAAGTAYLTMEYLEGETLKQRLDRLRILTVSEAIRIVRQVASGLHAAHQRSVIHRDLKPDNLMIVPDSELPGGERVKILDFGVAKISEGLGDQTRTGMVMGTPAYMAPEQCREAKLATDRSDVYSLGVILYQTLAGQPPFVGEYAGDVMAMQMMKEPPPLSQFCPLLQRPVVEFVHRLLEKKPALRPGMEEVIRELQRLYDLIVGSQTQGLRLDQLASSPVLAQSAVRPAIRQQTEALTAEEIRRFAQSANQPVDSSRNPVVRSGPEPVAERPTTPLSMVHLVRSTAAPLEPEGEPTALSISPALAQVARAKAVVTPLSPSQKTPNLDASAKPDGRFGRASTSSTVTLAAGQHQSRFPTRVLVPGIVAFVALSGLALFVSVRTTSVGSIKPTETRGTPAPPVSAKLDTPKESPIPHQEQPSAASLATDQDPPEATESKQPAERTLMRDESWRRAYRAYSAGQWVDAIKFGSQCSGTGESKFKCPWIVAMASCQLIRSEDDHNGKIDRAKLLADALTALRAQEKSELIADVDKACEKPFPAVPAPEKAPQPESTPQKFIIPSEIRDPFQGLR